MMSGVAKSAGVTYMFPRFDADHAASGGPELEESAYSGSHPGYESPLDVVTLVIRPCAVTKEVDTRPNRERVYHMSAVRDGLCVQSQTGEYVRKI